MSDLAAETVTTPRPWRRNDPRAWNTLILNEQGRAVCTMSGASFEDDADLILRAVNSHDELVAALKAILAAAREDEKGECWTIRKYLAQISWRARHLQRRHSRRASFD